MSRRLEKVSRFDLLGRLKTVFHARLDEASPYDRRTDLPKDPTADRLAAASKVDRQTGLPKEAP